MYDGREGRRLRAWTTRICRTRAVALNMGFAIPADRPDLVYAEEPQPGARRRPISGTVNNAGARPR